MNLRDTIALIQNGGPGSGCKGPNCGRKPSGRTEDNYDNIRSVEQLDALMKTPKYMDGRCYVVSVVFGHTRVTGYDVPSKIPYNAVGDSARGLDGYYRNGKIEPFAAKLRSKYQNSALGAE